VGLKLKSSDIRYWWNHHQIRCNGTVKNQLYS